MKINKTELLLSAQRALLFSIICSIRFIFIDIKFDKLILSIYTDMELSEDEKDIYYSVIGEICGDFSAISNDSCEVQFYVEHIKFEEINNQGELIYARYNG